jgi:hypothetical protein
MAEGRRTQRRPSPRRGHLKRFAKPTFLKPGNRFPHVTLAGYTRARHRRVRRSEVAMTNAAARTVPFNAASTWIATLAAVAFFLLGVRALVAPAGAAASFGVPLDGGSGLVFVQAFGARNVGLSLVALASIALDARRGLAVVFLAAAVVAGLDFTIVATHGGASTAIKHLGYVLALGAFGVWFARR